MAGHIPGAVAGEVTLTWDPSPDPDVSGYIIHYRFSSGNTDNAEVRLMVAPQNDVPIAVDDVYTLLPGGTLSVPAANGVLANDTDPDDDALEAVLLSGPVNGTLTFNADGSFNYQHDGGLFSEGRFTYQVNDGEALSSPATVTITTKVPAPLAPTIVLQPNDQLTMEGQSPNFEVAASGTAPISYQWERNGTALVGEVGAILVLPPVTLSENGDRFRCVVTNAAGSATSAEATLTVSPRPSNDSPTAVDDDYVVVEGSSFADAANGVLANDSHPEGDALEALLLSGPANGRLAFSDNGLFIYEHGGSEMSSDSFVYEVRGKAAGKISVGNRTSYTLSGLDGPQAYYFVVTANDTNSVRTSAYSNEVVAEIPLAEFTGTPVYGLSRITVDFSDASMGNITSWNWDFGDGSGSTEKNPTHDFVNTGAETVRFTVTLTVAGPTGSDTEIKTDYITVEADTDGDGIGNDSDRDDDNDGVPDSSDAFPFNPAASVDNDSDGMGDAFESRFGLDPDDPNDADLDSDADGLTNLDEFQAGRNPNVNEAGALQIINGILLN
jgi:PKD repeat protein